MLMKTVMKNQKECFQDMSKDDQIIRHLQNVGDA